MSKIVCLGNAVWDRVFEMEKTPRQPTKYFATGYFENGGGIAATAAVACVRLGAQAVLISRLGDDSNGTLIRNELMQWGVDVSGIHIFANTQSSHAVIHVDSEGERQITVFRDSKCPASPDWLNASVLEGADCLLCDTSWPEGALWLIAEAKKRHIPTVLDLDLGASRMDELVAQGDHLAFSLPGLRLFTQQHEIADALKTAQKKTKGAVYVTCGAQGCYWLDGNEVRHAPAFSVRCVDTTGAGDVFHGALAVAIAEKRPTCEAIRFANAVAALKCTREGGRKGIPDRQQLAQFVGQHA
ncbi:MULTISPECIES: sugar kinase [Tenebrionibacter/Tenebrionicola group]|jgi:sulfofructose kinase|uniref:Sugar kinase n=2 Tax=Tenebrionibacter/Tenebrionicola group TaxID=2969848 RepID=A0A8K0V0E1_9ENTR|nr:MULTISPECIES: sugar kinase [Tenebrionibacter/Tenebrionicola group]MBK4714458.1 sugar kinase [Tenebrionibacter intestinalis]MBV4412830.1 sugar kinase [Tenebrionicola larvae]MBV5095317.1 sugar kinase [Tenebrionicola larvae]